MRRKAEGTTSTRKKKINLQAPTAAYAVTLGKTNRDREKYNKHMYMDTHKQGYRHKTVPGLDKMCPVLVYRRHSGVTAISAWC